MAGHKLFIITPMAISLAIDAHTVSIHHRNSSYDIIDLSILMVMVRLRCCIFTVCVHVTVARDMTKGSLVPRLSCALLESLVHFLTIFNVRG